MIVVQNSLIEATTKLDRHHKILVEGNGEKPLLERVRNIETFIDGIKFWQRTLALVLFGNLVTLVSGAIYTIVKILPLLERIASQP